ncbi:MAG: putative mariner transposase [Streblomastix strix]|uniref:Putative mariner transposase n=1 Tax=Streblomastix strix TaxID=222440 RepID=A0A5J4TK95_9EUKA|nr:MAG: putative mariner transposase [Streblomastix strix]
MTVVRHRIDHLRFRVLVEDRLRRNFENSAIYSDLREIYGKISPEMITIYKWRKEFEVNQTLVTYVSAPGRPKIIGLGPQIEKQIIQDNYVSLRYLANLFQHDKETISRIIEDETDFIQQTHRWVPHTLSRSNKDQRVEYSKELLPQIKSFVKNNFLDIVTGDETWIYLKNYALISWIKKSDEQPETPRGGIGDEKRMYTVFFSGVGIEYVHVLPKKQTMDSEVFVNDILKPLEQQIIKERNPKEGQIHLHFDNCRVHTSYYTQRYLDHSIFTKLKHPAYSPDISPCDFYLFGLLKSELKGKIFKNENEMEIEVNKILHEIHPLEIQRALGSWIRRLEYIIKHDGKYYNKDKW